MPEKFFFRLSRSPSSGLPVVGGVAVCMGLSPCLELGRDLFAAPLILSPRPSAELTMFDVSSLGVIPAISMSSVLLFSGGGGGGGGGGAGGMRVLNFLLSGSSAPAIASSSSRLRLRTPGLEVTSAGVDEALYSASSSLSEMSIASSSCWLFAPSLETPSSLEPFSAFRFAWLFLFSTAFSKKFVTYFLTAFSCFASILLGSLTRLFLKSDSTSFLAICAHLLALSKYGTSAHPYLFGEALEIVSVKLALEFAHDMSHSWKQLYMEH